MSSSLIFVELDSFYVKALGMTGSQPSVIHRDKQVLDLNHAAEARGLTRSMGLAEAKAMLGGEGLYVAWESDPYSQARDAWLDVLTEYADVIEPISQHQCYIDLTAHPDPIEVATLVQVALEKRTGLRVKLGIGASRWIAQLRTAIPSQTLDSLAVSRLPFDKEITQRLNALGCRTIGDVAQIPQRQLKLHFDKLAHLILQASRGHGPAEVIAAYPPNSIANRFVFDGAVESREVIENGIRHICKSVGGKLVEEGLFSKQLIVWLEPEDGAIERRERTFGKPIGSPASLFVGLSQLLARLDQPLVSIRVRLPDLQAKRRVQRTLAGITANDAKDDSVQNALSQLRSKFGNQSILLADHVPMERYQRVRQAWRAVNGWSWK